MSSVREEYSAQIRAMQHGDLAAIADVERRSYEFPWSQGVFRDCLLAGYLCSVLDYDGAVTGYSILSVAADEAHVLNLCIGPDWRGYGYGSLLLDNLLSRADHAGVNRILLEVRPSNRQAVRLYLKRGFVRIGERRNYYQAEVGREDALVLALTLGKTPDPRLLR